jgi:ADP-ribose pyrophosphatase YjhB (NUDIX family)
MANWGDFCTYCGVAMEGEFPRKCNNGHYTYASPVTVGIALQPIRNGTHTGILVVQRNINPYKGEFALPGGFVDQGELSKPAAVRELFEETGIRASLQAAQYFAEITGGSHNDHDLRKHNMYFYALPVLDKNEIDLNFTNGEAQSLQVFYLSADGSKMIDENGVEVKLCFNSHHTAALQFLQQ